MIYLVDKIKMYLMMGLSFGVRYNKFSQAVEELEIEMRFGRLLLRNTMVHNRFLLYFMFHSNTNFRSVQTMCARSRDW